MLGRAVIAALVLGVLLAGCGGATSAKVAYRSTTTTAGPTTTTEPVTTTTTTPGPAKLGTAWSMTDPAGDFDLNVEVDEVIDPAAPDNTLDAAQEGERLVGVEMSVQNQSSTPFTDDMDSDATVIGSDSQTYTAVANGLSGCTNFDYGDVDLVKGATASGCVAFSLPVGVTAAQVDFKPGADFGGAPVEWNAG